MFVTLNNNDKNGLTLDTAFCLYCSSSFCHITLVFELKYVKLYCSYLANNWFLSPEWQWHHKHNFEKLWLKTVTGHKCTAFTFYPTSLVWYKPNNKELMRRMVFYAHFNDIQGGWISLDLKIYLGSHSHGKWNQAHIPLPFLLNSDIHKCF